MNDWPLRSAQAREELTEALGDVFEVGRDQAQLLMLSLLTTLIQHQQAGGARVYVRENSYFVGALPLLPEVRELAGLRPKYEQLYVQQPAQAHLLIQRALLARLVPHASRGGAA
ncbi:hypothetical protein E5F05_04605 (plasmid) [Deinococcus metallilatus]|uniref:Uncharacterized protein n=1 Tax=Deinococcus metallilatus TaxID=1211322 RepID=A0AAJ5F6J6_9DEIO|nr:hypothetical protein [Deinococcus metallilatus]MBB5293773.1 hypothetical protein [Deinococcus metallilatus]QBY07268.1 hypothetical protein E5F05_04605 [Deinococcus metallilatus]RXJ14740.1 hypothetical protein ERJ73_03335 [Deinococcus metallilatus]TLK30860.1 hypothetical protein FCS05_03650 [Deinococcus metallilatus]